MEQQKGKKENWEYVLINGSSRSVQVLNANWNKGKIISIEDGMPKKRNDKGEEVKTDLEFIENEKRKLYQDFFRKSFKNLLVLSGAGSSIDVGGKSMYQLWEIVERKYHFKEKKDQERNVITESILITLSEKINFDHSSRNLEGLLSKIEGTLIFNTDIDIENNGKKIKLSDVKSKILETIRTACTIPKPSSDFPHKTFLEKILQRKQTNPRIKVFTLNYDTLFEDAAQNANAVIIDGFSYTNPRTFSGRFFDYDIVQREGSKLNEEDNFIQRVFHLHKLHGSINWEREIINGEVIINSSTTDPLMVYPRSSKYEDSYEQPFFEMMARFQRSLRLNHDTLLICIGYSFNDKHINTAIEEALNQNPGFRLAVIDPGINNPNGAINSLKEQALKSNRILMVAETFMDFAQYYPEIQTYEDLQQDKITLNS